MDLGKSAIETHLGEKNAYIWMNEYKRMMFGEELTSQNSTELILFLRFLELELSLARREGVF